MSNLVKNNTNFSLLTDYQNCYFTNGLIRYFGTFIFIIGIISTALSICVFARKPLRRKSCCFYFLILAISDSIHLLTMIIEHLPYSFHIDLIIIHTSICKIIIFLIYFSNHLSNIVLTLASVDRFILIYCRARSKRYCTLYKAKWFVCVSIVILSISNAHLLYGYEKIHLNDIYDCNIRHENIFYKNFFQFYDTYIESILFVIIPFFIMFICSLLIILQIVETRKTIRYNSKGKFYYYTFYTNETGQQTDGKKLKTQGKIKLRDKDIQLCCMLIGTTFAFLILCLPTEINDLFNYTGREHSCFRWFRKVLLMLMQQIYYAGHFYIYTLTGQLFRKHLHTMLFGRPRRHHQAFINKRNQFLPSKFSSNFSWNRSNTTDQNEQAKPSHTNTNYIDTASHRPAMTIHEIKPIESPVTCIPHDPSQRLLSN